MPILLGFLVVKDLIHQVLLRVEMESSLSLHILSKVFEELRVILHHMLLLGWLLSSFEQEFSLFTLLSLRLDNLLGP